MGSALFLEECIDLYFLIGFAPGSLGGGREDIVSPMHLIHYFASKTAMWGSQGGR